MQVCRCFCFCLPSLTEKSNQKTLKEHLLAHSLIHTHGQEEMKKCFENVFAAPRFCSGDPLADNGTNSAGRTAPKDQFIHIRPVCSGCGNIEVAFQGQIVINNVVARQCTQVPRLVYTPGVIAGQWPCQIASSAQPPR